jgi:hypothetical protein
MKLSILILFLFFSFSQPDFVSDIKTKIQKMVTDLEAKVPDASVKDGFRSALGGIVIFVMTKNVMLAGGFVAFGYLFLDSARLTYAWLPFSLGFVMLFKKQMAFGLVLLAIGTVCYCFKWKLFSV